MGKQLAIAAGVGVIYGLCFEILVGTDSKSVVCSLTAGSTTMVMMVAFGQRVFMLGRLPFTFFAIVISPVAFFVFGLISGYLYWLLPWGIHLEGDPLYIAGTNARQSVIIMTFTQMAVATVPTFVLAMFALRHWRAKSVL